MDGYQVVVTWDGLKTDFDDDDEVPFDEPVAEAVAEWVLITLSGEIDKNVSQREEHKTEYARLRKYLFLDCLDRKRQRETRPSPFPKGCPVSTCSCCSSLSSALSLCRDSIQTGLSEPEGVETGSPPDLYIRDDGTNYELWIKRTGSDTKTGWVLAIKFS